ncbi:hypothetical protein H4F33_20515 [Pectobacterium brasiliense]|uniref:Uncharacterized protein n=1 Tax=Pectobacterium brasiliense TaxID=180957 RepID=A0AAE3BE07_9GAMM|nr:hypothetical protein [Pectobacterium brasiliense]MBA0219817.1 hypothetical protein [Pectobacterium brasiliense]MBN3051397.1 hypothetical protein [Pectobacterium brasiliense]MBN3074433.1 hypothetical protein [Pectobacterium brasiliense]MBN3171144.1 hypothetical protein [Pectobacterium brasiliense]
MGEVESNRVSVKERTKWTDAVKDLRHSGLMSKVNIPNLSQLGKIDAVKLKDLVDKLFHEGYQPRKVIFLNKDRFFVAQDFATGTNLYSLPKGTKVSYAYRMQHPDGRTYPVPYVGYKYALLLFYRNYLDGKTDPNSLGITDDLFNTMVCSAKSICEKHSSLYREVNDVKDESLNGYDDTSLIQQAVTNIRRNKI